MTTFTLTGGYAGKVRCDVCGREGYGPELTADEAPVEADFSPWQRACLQGHPFGCSCGRRFTSQQARLLHLKRYRKEGHRAA